MSNKDDGGKKFDLAERTARFGEAIIRFVKTLDQNAISTPLIRQLVRSGTSIGANYMEADTSDSSKDFRYKIALCRKESKETTHWLRMMKSVYPEREQEIRSLWQEAYEFVLIFSAILKSKK